MKSPCYNCSSRKRGCHSVCVEYIEFQRLMAKAKEQKIKEGFFLGYQRSLKYQIDKRKSN